MRLAAGHGRGDIAFCQNCSKAGIGTPRSPDPYDRHLLGDHCRHTTFGTILDDVQIEDETGEEAA